jgi:hypothetical protein
MGKILRLDAAGKVLASADSPAEADKKEINRSEVESMYGEKLSDARFEEAKERLRQRKQGITGLAVSGEDLFVACPSPSDFGFAVYRLTRELKDPKLVLKGLRGCCGQMDIQAREGKLWVAHNARHLVECYDREGKKLTSFGKFDRAAADGFGGCCEPKNLRLATDGNVYASESGPPVCVKRFSADGKFGGVVSLPKFESACVRVTVEVSPDCKRFYILSTGDDAIHVLVAAN